MANNLGQLIVEITTDLTNLNKGLIDAEKKIKDSSGKISELVNKVGLTMTAIGGAITATFGLMIKSSVDYSDQIYEVSRRTGITVESLSALKYVADQTESSFEAVAIGLRYLSRNIYEATNGNIKAGESFRILGITLRDEVTGNTLKAEEAFLKIADKFKGITDESAKTALAIQISGRQGASIIPVLNLGSEGIMRLSDEAHRLGIVLTAENAKAIDRFSDGMKSMRAAVGGLWLEITTLLLPSLDNLVKKITDIVVKIREWTEAHPQLSKRIAETTLGIGALMLVIGPLLLMITQIIKNVVLLNLLFPTTIALLGKIGAVGIAAFAGWNIGRIISEVSGLDNALSGPKGLFTRMFEWLDKNEKKIQNIQRVALAIATLGFSEFGKKSTKEMKGLEEGAIPTIDLGKIEVSKSATELDQTVNLVERHIQKLKELNEEYIAGKITTMEYYNAVKELHSDGIDATIALGEAIRNLAYAEGDLNDKKMQEAAVIEECIRAIENYGRIKAEMANQDQIYQKNSLDAATNLLQTLQSMHIATWQGIFDFINMGVQKMSQGLTTALSSIILGTKKASEAFKDFGKTMIEAIVEFLVEWAVQAMISITLGWLLAKMVSKIADSIAQAWLPAAVLASVATMGGADVAGTVGLAGALGAGAALFKGMKTAQAAELVTLGEGGIVTQPTLALIGEKGPEAIVPLDKGNTTTFGDIKIELTAIINNDQDINILAQKLGTKIEEQLRYARGF